MGRTLGVHIVAGVAYLGAVDEPDKILLSDDVDRLLPAAHLSGSEQLADFSERFRQILRRMGPDVVGVVSPRRHGGWVYREAFTRVSLEVAIMLACAKERISFRQITQEKAAGAVSVPVSTLAATYGDRLGIKLPPRWRN